MLSKNKKQVKVGIGVMSLKNNEVFFGRGHEDPEKGTKKEKLLNNPK